MQIRTNIKQADHVLVDTLATNTGFFSFLVCVISLNHKLYVEPLRALQAYCLDTYPCKLVLLDGSEGMAQTRNRALREYAATTKADILIQMDANLDPGSNFLHHLARGFYELEQARIKPGILGLDLSHQPEGAEYMQKALDKPVKKITEDVHFRDCSGGQNVGGKLHAMRRKEALAMGEIPIAKRKDGSETTYQVYEDYWRCHRMWQKRLHYGYIVQPVPEDERAKGLFDLVPEGDYRDTKVADAKAGIDQLQMMLVSKPKPVTDRA